MTSAAASESKRRGSTPFLLEIFLVAMAIILLEVSYTRIFSYKLFYYFTYLIIGISLLGLGAGGVFVSISPRLRNAPLERLLPSISLAAALVTPLSFSVAALTQLNASMLTSSVAELPKLAVICTALFLPFLLGGIILSAVFASHSDEIDRLYFADLVGAALGCAAIIPLMRAITPPGCVVLAGAIFGLASLRLASTHARSLLAPGIVLSALGIIGALVPGLLPDPVPDQAKNMAPHRLAVDVTLAHSQWDPVFRVDVIAPGRDSPFGSTGLLYLSHDGIIGSSIRPYNGDPSTLADLDADPRSIPFDVLGEEPSVLIIGAAGGQEVLTSLYFDAGRITAVELNPVTHSLLTGKFADFSGRIMQHERVDFINAEGRAFLSRSEQEFDLVWLVAPDSYAAMNAATSGAYVLSESYLFTVEMIRDALAHLGTSGLLCVQFGEIDFEGKPKRSTRYLATAREAMRQQGVDDFPRHVLVATTPDFLWPMATILLKPTPFTEAEVNDFRAGLERLDRAKSTPERAGTIATEEDVRDRPLLWHAAGRAIGTRGDHPANKVIGASESELEAWHDGFAYDVRPISDDGPFFYHFVRFRDAISRSWGGESVVWDPEEATGERILLALLAFSTAFAAALLLLPFLAVREGLRRLPYKITTACYFAALGLGFMFFEVCLIQQLTLFLGYPTYSLSVTLFAMLLSTALGSYSSGRLSLEPARALAALLALLVLLTAFYSLGLGALVEFFGGAPFTARVALATLFVSPLGLCLGVFMPLGLRFVGSLGDGARQYVAWCWAVNGFFSVIASLLATILSMTLGFRWLLVIALGVYVVGVVPLWRLLASLRNSN